MNLEEAIFNIKEASQFEDFCLSFKIKGNLIPDNAYILLDDKRFQLKKSTSNNFEYLFKSVSSDIDFSFFAGGFYSPLYKLKAIPKPTVLDFKTLLVYPNYINKTPEILNNIGDLEVPEGTEINWEFT